MWANNILFVDLTFFKFGIETNKYLYPSCFASFVINATNRTVVHALADVEFKD